MVFNLVFGIDMSEVQLLIESYKHFVWISEREREREKREWRFGHTRALYTIGHSAVEGNHLFHDGPRVLSEPTI